MHWVWKLERKQIVSYFARPLMQSGVSEDSVSRILRAQWPIARELIQARAAGFRSLFISVRVKELRAATWGAADYCSVSKSRLQRDPGKYEYH